MDILTKSVFALMINFIFGIIFAVLVIPILKKRKADQRLSEYLRESHSSKKGTPTMGGLIFIIPTIVTYMILFFMNKVSFSYNGIIVLLTFLNY